jgi:hypothetical protein
MKVVAVSVRALCCSKVTWSKINSLKVTAACARQAGRCAFTRLSLAIPWNYSFLLILRYTTKKSVAGARGMRSPVNVYRPLQHARGLTVRVLVIRYNFKFVCLSKKHRRSTVNAILNICAHIWETARRCRLYRFLLYHLIIQLTQHYIVFSWFAIS